MKMEFSQQDLELLQQIEQKLRWKSPFSFSKGQIGYRLNDGYISKKYEDKGLDVLRRFLSEEYKFIEKALNADPYRSQYTQGYTGRTIQVSRSDLLEFIHKPLKPIKISGFNHSFKKEEEALRKKGVEIFKRGDYSEIEEHYKEVDKLSEMIVEDLRRKDRLKAEKRNEEFQQRFRDRFKKDFEEEQLKIRKARHVNSNQDLSQKEKKANEKLLKLLKELHRQANTIDHEMDEEEYALNKDKIEKAQHKSDLENCSMEWIVLLKLKRYVVEKYKEYTKVGVQQGPKPMKSFKWNGDVEKEVPVMYDLLIGKQIPRDTKEEDFISAFSNKEVNTFNQIAWPGELVLLVYLIDSLAYHNYISHTNKWKITARVFGVNYDSVKSTANTLRKQGGPIHHQPIDAIIEALKSTRKP